MPTLERFQRADNDGGTVSAGSWRLSRVSHGIFGRFIITHYCVIDHDC